VRYGVTDSDCVLPGFVFAFRVSFPQKTTWGLCLRVGFYFEMVLFALFELLLFWILFISKRIFYLGAHVRRGLLGVSLPSITSFCLRCVCGLALSFSPFELGSCVFLCILLATSSRSIYDATNLHQCPLISSAIHRVKSFDVCVRISGVHTWRIWTCQRACWFLLSGENSTPNKLHTPCRLTASLLALVL